MDKITIYGAIQYLFFKKMNTTKIQHTLGNDAPLNATIFHWVDGTKRGDMSLEDEERLSLPKRVTIAIMVEEIHDFVLGDRRSKVEEVVNTADMSSERVYHIFPVEFGMS